MKQFIPFIITALVSIAFCVVFGLLIRPRIDDHSQKFQDLELKDAQVRASEKILTDRLQSLYESGMIAQRRIDSLEAIVVSSGGKFAIYEKQLREIKSSIKSTHFQDSSKTTIIKNLPK